MSAFLGPIHYWLYNKIKLQQSIINEIYNLGNKHGLSLKEETERNFGSLDDSPLEEIIDESNIHGWLQERVSQVEYKYAYSVTELLKKAPQAMDALKTLLNEKGVELGKEIKITSINAPKLYRVISDNLLDGMPCDHANSVVSQSEEEVIWKRNLCVHEDYWKELGGDIHIYYELRDEWIKGLVEECAYTFVKIDPSTYQIKA